MPITEKQTKEAVAKLIKRAMANLQIDLKLVTTDTTKDLIEEEINKLIEQLKKIRIEQAKQEVIERLHKSIKYID